MITIKIMSKKTTVMANVRTKPRFSERRMRISHQIFQIR